MSFERTTGIIVGATLAGAALTACSAEQSPTPDNGITAEYNAEWPTVESAAQLAPPDFDLINTSDITSAVKEQPLSSNDPSKSPYEIYGAHDPKTGKIIPDFPYSESAPIMQIKRGQDGALRYNAQVSAAVPDRQKDQLLRTVENNKDILEASMSKHNIDEIRFRIFAPTSITKMSLPDESHAFYLPKDVLNNDKPVLYYYLPSDTVIDGPSVKLMEEHETIHSLYMEGTESVANKLTPAEKHTLQVACDTINAESAHNMKTAGAFVLQRLDILQQYLPAQYVNSFATVENALTSGTYNTLPKDSTQIQDPECRVPAPLEEVVQVALRQGLALQPFTDAFKNDTYFDQADKIHDDWQNAMQTDDAPYSDLREANSLELTEDTKRHGHPQDGIDEMITSFTNEALQGMDTISSVKLAELKAEPQNVKDAVRAIVDTGMNRLIREYDGFAKFTDRLKQQRDAFDAQLK